MSDDTHYTIRVPKFDGYKTIVVNLASVLLGVLAVARPQWVLPTPETIGLAYDQMAGALVTLLGAVNVVLRLLTSKPPAKPVNLLRTPKPDGYELGWREAAAHFTPMLERLRAELETREALIARAYGPHSEALVPVEHDLAHTLAASPSGRHAVAVAFLVPFLSPSLLLMITRVWL
jgi:hypothetical protein